MDILDSDLVTFGLRFNSLNMSDWFMINEPVGFDAAKLKTEQEPKRFARQRRYLEVDKLTFIDAWGIPTGVSQIINPLGDASEHLNYGLEWLLPIHKEFGFEMDVDFGIFVNGVLYESYQLDAKGKDLTDGYTYFQCALIDNGKVADYKRNYDTTLNAFADKGVFEQAVTPIETLNYLRRAIPQEEISNFTVPTSFNRNEVLYGGDAYVYNPCIQVNSYGISNTLTSFEAITYLNDTADTDLVKSLIQERTIVKAKKRITNLRIDISELNLAINVSGFFVNHRLRVAYGNVPLDDWTTIDLFSSSSSFSLTNQSYSVVIPYLEIGQKVWLYFSSTSPNPLPAPSPISNIAMFISNSMKVDLIANSSSLDNVQKAVRYVDLMKQGNKMVHDLPFNATKFDVSGQFYDQFCFNKRMVSQNTDFLYFTLKQIYESLEEVCADVEISEEEMFIGQFEDFYTNDEIGVYTQIPSEGLTIDVNDRFACNKFKFDYSNFAQDRTLLGTSEAVHTQSEWKLQNIKVENVKEIKNDLVRDPFAIQDIVDLEISKPTTSTDSDNTICIEDVIQLAPSSFGILYAILLVRIINGRLEILNRDSEGDSGDAPINWLTLGMGVGQNVEILNGTNAGIYIVYSITANVLILTPTFAMSPANGDGYIELKYYYTNVLWQTRTNQGFSLIDGVTPKFANLRYTIKRNMFHWYKYIASMLMYSKKDIINSFFKSNGALKTRLTTESVDVVENGTILFSDLPEPIITGNILNLTIVGKFDEIKERMDLYKTKKGFIRFLDLMGEPQKGYIQQDSFLLSDRGLTFVVEEKYEPQILIVTFVSGVLSINGTPYPQTTGINWFRADNDYIKFFDENNKAITKFYKFDAVNFNSVIYPSINDLVMVLNTII